MSPWTHGTNPYGSPGDHHTPCAASKRRMVPTRNPQSEITAQQLLLAWRQEGNPPCQGWVLESSPIRSSAVFSAARRRLRQKGMPIDMAWCQGHRHGRRPPIVLAVSALLVHSGQGELPVGAPLGGHISFHHVRNHRRYPKRQRTQPFLIIPMSASPRRTGPPGVEVLDCTACVIRYRRQFLICSASHSLMSPRMKFHRTHPRDHR